MTEIKPEYQTNLEIHIDHAAQAKLYAKLSRVMGKMGRIEKRGHNTHFNYDFVTSEDVVYTVRQALAEENVSFFPSIIGVEQVEVDTKTGTTTKIKTRFQFVFADGETGATQVCYWEGEALDSQDKGISKAATSVVKYFLLKTFLIATGDEPDPDSDGKNAPKPRAQKVATSKEIKPNNGSKKIDPTTEYYNLAYNTLKWSKEEVKDVLSQAGGDFEKALELAKAQLPPE